MADITLPYTPVDGNTFDPSSWDANLDSAVVASSIYGEMNGLLSDANFAAGAKIRPEHPKPGETFRYAQSHLPETLDYFQDAFDASTSEGDSPVTGSDPFLTVAGASARVFLPYNCTCVWYHVAAFYTLFQMRQRSAGSEAEVRSGPVAQMAMYIDGTKVQYTQRRTPRTYHPYQQAAPAATSPPPRANEAFLASHLDIAHLAISNGSDPTRTQAGWHQVDLRLYIPTNTGQEQFAPPYKPAAANIEYPVPTRMRFGVRSARVLALL